MDGDEVVVVTGTAQDIPRLRPLWVAVHHHHQEAMPQLAPYVDDDTTWDERSSLYRDLLAKPDTILLIAQVADRAVGYGLAHVLEARDTWLADTWATGERIGEIESLAVEPEQRGNGVGSRLLSGLVEGLHAQGVHDHILGVLPGNTEAILLYERHGYHPVWTYLTNRPR